MLRRKYADLFRFTNYKFSTTEKGRQTSLYFADVAGNQGRWRREHRDGELLVYQGKSLRFFVADAEAGDFLDANGENPSIGDKIWMELRDGLPIAGYSAAITTGTHVVELVPPTYFMGHGSGGTVILNDHTAGAAAFDGLVEYTGEITDWTEV